MALLLRRIFLLAILYNIYIYISVTNSVVKRILEFLFFFCCDWKLCSLDIFFSDIYEENNVLLVLYRFIMKKKSRHYLNKFKVKFLDPQYLL